MRLRTCTTAAATAASLLLVPLATAAGAVTTTSTIIVYNADTDGDGLGELWTGPADGSGTAAKVFSTTNRVWLPALSPDGTRVAYLEDRSGSTNAYSNFRLFARNTDGSGTATLLYSADDVYGAPAWSRDGARLVFSTFNWDTGASATYIVGAGGGALTAVPTASTGGEPSFAPSGEQVAVDSIDDSGAFVGIDLVTLANGAGARIAGTSGGSDPSWSPDGQYILFQKFLPTCGVGLYRVPAGGGTPVTMREVAGYSLGAAEYSRDGSQIFFSQVRQLSCNPGTRAGDIWMMNADGSGAARVTNTTSITEYAPSVAGGTPAPADTTPPAAPAGTTAVVNGTGVTLSWPAGGDATDFVVLRKAEGEPAPTSPADGTLVYAGPAHSARATAPAGTVVDLYVFARDSSGNLSEVSAVHRARALAPPVMAAVPVVGSATTDTTSLVRWSDTGSATYQVQTGKKVRSSTGVWATRPTFTSTFTTANRELAHTGTQAQSYYFRARASDGFGNYTDWAATPSVSHVPVNENNAAVAYGSGWTARTSSARYLGTFRTASAAGSTLTLRAETARFVVRGDKCAKCGAVKVYVDGVYRGTVDTRADTTKVRQTLYAGSRFAKVGLHTLKLVVAGTAGRPLVSIDSVALER